MRLLWQDRGCLRPVIRKKVEEYGGEVKGIYYAPDDESYIEARLKEIDRLGVRPSDHHRRHVCRP